MLRVVKSLCVVALVAMGMASVSPSDQVKPAPRAVLESVSRASWGASDATESAMVEQVGELRFVTIHHTAWVTEAGADEAETLRRIQRFHQVDRGWGDIAYHYLIGPSGKVYQGRDPRFESDTGTGYDTTGHLNICLLGNFEEQHPSDEALRALVELASQQLFVCGLPADALRTHRRVAATLCPGEHLEAWLVREGDTEIGARLGALREP